MNQTQLKYAKERVLKIYNSKAKEITVKFTTPAVTLTTDQKMSALKKGDFTVKSQALGQSNLWYNLIDFGETYAKVDTAGRDAALKELNNKFEQLMDELVLGDNETALAMIKEFESVE